MTEEFSITTSLDQSLPVEVQDELDRVDTIMNQSIADKDVDAAFGLCGQYAAGMKVRGLALCKALHLMNENWNVYNVGDEFIDVAYQYLGLVRHTVERYIKIWDLFSVVPTEYLPAIQQMNLKTLAPIAFAVAQGNELEDKDWEKITDDTSFAYVNKYVREEIKGQDPRKSGLPLSIDREGSIWAHTEDNWFFIGSLEVGDTEPTIKKAINRIVNNSGILER